MNLELSYFKELNIWNELNILYLMCITSNEQLFDCINNLKLLNSKTNFTYNLMKQNTIPLWEKNKNHSIYSIKIIIDEEINDKIAFIIYLLYNDKIYIKNKNCISGLTFKSNENNVIIKFWFLSKQKIFKDEIHPFLQQFNFIYNPPKN